MRVSLHDLGRLGSLASARMMLWAGARLGLSLYNGKYGERWWSVGLDEMAGVLGMAGQRPDAVTAAIKKARADYRYSPIFVPMKDGKRIVGYRFAFRNEVAENHRAALSLVSQSRSRRERNLDLWAIDTRPRLRAEDLRLLVSPERVDALKVEPAIAAAGGLKFLDDVASDFSLGHDLREGDDVETLFSDYARQRAVTAADPVIGDLPAVLVDEILARP